MPLFILYLSFFLSNFPNFPFLIKKKTFSLHIIPNVNFPLSVFEFILSKRVYVIFIVEANYHDNPAQLTLTYSSFTTYSNSRRKFKKSIILFNTN